LPVAIVACRPAGPGPELLKPEAGFAGDLQVVGIIVARHANRRGPSHRGPFHALLRANRIVVLAVLWVALVVCIVAALVFDVAGWLSAWRDAGLERPASAAAALLWRG
jgi:hypothetical protein